MPPPYLPAYEYGQMPLTGPAGGMPPAGPAAEIPGYEYGYVPAATAGFPGAGSTGESTYRSRSGDADMVEQAVDDDLALFRIEGGKYSPQDKKRAAEDPAGLVRTASIIGKQEERLIDNDYWPFTITVSKEWMRFEEGKMGDYVLDWNDFTVYMHEVLRSIGRLRDLLSAGAPKYHPDMNDVQKRAFRPTGDTGKDATTKTAYRTWRASQAKYVGLVFDVAEKGRNIERARQSWWEAQGTLERTIADFKRLGEPTFEMDLKLSDLVLAFSILTITLATPAAAVATIAAGGDRMLDARKARETYDAKMKEFAAAVQNAHEDVKKGFRALREAEKTYLEYRAKHRQAHEDLKTARHDSRENAALVGEFTANRVDARGRGKILGQVRMPVMVADAWHALASFGPPARRKYLKLFRGFALIDRASVHDWSWKRNPYAEIAEIRRTWNRAKRLREAVLTEENIEMWVTGNRWWEEMLAKFNV
jgi:hypothetical protein